ncbi:MAG: ABC transporter ATP-binding protein [Saprospiraceae bacterium]
MMNTAFQINDLECCYRAGRTVLHVPQLEIGKGKTVFLLGPSGIGKSTFIEAIGLMNDTMRDKAGTSVVFYDEKNGKRELKGSWKGDNDDLSHFRNRYYSFIFQHTNLMPNFTAGENMCISRLIRGVPLAEAREEVLATMEELKLEPDIFYKKTTHLSGGQRQRVAFVRAITAEFEVLFGDEPTGNLDKDTAFRLMTILKNNLERHHRTAIIVSHDLDLALHFADQIVLMTFTGENGERHGIIRPENVLENKGGNWHDVDGGLLKNPTFFVNERMKQ